ncbi:MAG: DUF2452 domain-containing protein [Verrucomicrobiota bacterium]
MADLSQELQLQPEPHQRFLPYPTSTLSPPITPTDLTNFKTYGISEVERVLKQQLDEIRQRYVSAIDEFNWNKLLYESELRFEPMVGQTCHLYRVKGEFTVSLIGPSEWKKEWLGSFTLGADRRWQPEAVSDHVDTEELFALEVAS